MVNIRIGDENINFKTQIHLEKTQHVAFGQV